MLFGAKDSSIVHSIDSKWVQRNHGEVGKDTDEMLSHRPSREGNLWRNCASGASFYHGELLCDPGGAAVLRL